MSKNNFKGNQRRLPPLKNSKLEEIDQPQEAVKTPRLEENPPVVIGITHGDMNGIGYEVILKTFSDTRMFDFCTPLLYGSSKIASYHKKLLDIPEYSYYGVREAQMVNQRKFNIFNITNEETKIDIGQSTPLAGELALSALDIACEDLRYGKIDALVTAPINKKNIQSKTFNFPGHTEYLTQKFGVEDSLMIMCCDRIRIGIATNHLALKDIPKHITSELMLNKLKVFHHSLRRDFGVGKPKIAVLALNPHAGDSGINGEEDQKIIAPTIQQANERGILAFGPYPADGFFGSGEYVHFDGVLAMYHDQGLIPFKFMSFDEGVNYTAGLPHVRTSPAHGTAYDIAGKNKASAQSFRNAVFLATDIVRNRQEYDTMTANPLKSAKRQVTVDEDIPMETNATDVY